MSRKKQINEMRYLADEMGKAISNEYQRRVIADERKLEEVLKANGWRKASELAEEIFAEIKKIVHKQYNRSLFGIVTDITPEIAELEKKYTEYRK